MNQFRQIKLVILIVGIFIFSLLIIYKLIYIKSIQSDSLIVPKIIYSQNRGDIYSANMQLLASSPINYNISFDPTVPADNDFNKKLSFLANQLHSFFPNQVKDTASFCMKIKKAKSDTNKYVPVLKNISFSALQLIQDFPFFEDGKIPGGYIEEPTRSKRVLLNGDLASVVLGALYPTLTDNNIYFGFGERPEPKYGLEKYYDYLLRGKEGFQLTKKLQGNIDKNLYSRSSVRPVPGKDIITTIDLELQGTAHDILQNHLNNNDARYGVLIIMEVKTGHIKCIVNLEKNKNQNYVENFNYAVRGPKAFSDRPSVKIEPGSTFKLASFMVYFEHGGNQKDTINAEQGTYKFPGVKKPVIDSKKLGVIDLKTAFAESSNIAICKLIYENYNSNPQKFLDGLHQLKLGDRTNIDLFGESYPTLYKNASNLEPGSLVSLAYGYEMGFAPIQILTFYNSIANDGIRVPPTLVTHYIENNKKILLNKNIHSLDPICSPKTINQAKDLLRSVVKDGTADVLSDFPISISGKTGTTKVNYSQPIDSLMWYQSSFAGFFPSEEPEYSFFVLIDEPKDEYYASKVAVPVIKDLLEQYYYPLQLLENSNAYTDLSKINFFAKPNQLAAIENMLDNEFQSSSSINDYMKITCDSDNFLVFDSIQNQDVPNVEGMLVGDALYFLESRGYNVKLLSGNNGKVISQSFDQKDNLNTVLLSIE